MMPGAGSQSEALGWYRGVYERGLRLSSGGLLCMVRMVCHVQSKMYKQRCTWAQHEVMQVLITVLNSHDKLRLLPDGTRDSAHSK
ncbi:hypothetical protein HaLaN_04715 [Haematococcus lacustris]|uniref:Uncharacterized protein n=1 Tax=Haematococcus lacustris TaxID=44745 RepID=A0A699YH99_HAELA|nr:hypothetical protein HaLaN_04715 [Haematococcus lacustris]